MAEATQIVFKHREIVEALVRKQGLTDGIWGLYVKFGIQGANIGPSEDGILPAAIVPIIEIGLQKFDKENNIAIDVGKLSKDTKSK